MSNRNKTSKLSFHLTIIFVVCAALQDPRLIAAVVELLLPVRAFPLHRKKKSQEIQTGLILSATCTIPGLAIAYPWFSRRPLPQG